MVKQKHEIAVGLEFTRTGGNMTDIASSKLAILGKAAALFGGAAWHEGVSAYRNPRTHQVVTEKSATITIVTNEPIGAFAEWVRKVMNQESVLVASMPVYEHFVRED